MTARYPDAVRNAISDLITARVDAGAAAGTLAIYTGAQPASANDAASGTLLVTFTLTDPSAAAAAAGVATLDFDPDLSATAVATGTAGWFRVADSNGVTVVDGACGATGSGAELELSSTAIVSGGTVTLSTGTVTTPADAA